MKEFKDEDKIVKQKVLVNVSCDICTTNIHKEYLTIKHCFGYESNKDGEKWEAHICEDCIDKYLNNLILFQKTPYLFNNDDLIKSLNKDNDDKRKERKEKGFSM